MWDERPTISLSETAKYIHIHELVFAQYVFNQAYTQNINTEAKEEINCVYLVPLSPNKQTKLRNGFLVFINGLLNTNNTNLWQYQRKMYKTSCFRVGHFETVMAATQSKFRMSIHLDYTIIHLNSLFRLDGLLYHATFSSTFFWRATDFSLLTKRPGGKRPEPQFNNWC